MEPDYLNALLNTFWGAGTWGAKEKARAAINALFGAIQAERDQAIAERDALADQAQRLIRRRDYYKAKRDAAIARAEMAEATR